MKHLQSLSIIALFFITLISCNGNSKDENETKPVSGYAVPDTSSYNSKKDSITTDTIKSPDVNGGVSKNNPDITK